MAAPWIPVHSIEIPLPRSVKVVRIWSTKKNTSPLQVALQYRASKTYSCSEMEYLELIRRIEEYVPVQEVFAVLFTGKPCLPE